LWTCIYSCVVQFVCFIVHDMQDQQIPQLPHKRRTSIQSPQCSGQFSIAFLYLFLSYETMHAYI
jgi:hypothetical protein